MNFLKYKSYLQLLWCFNKHNLLSFSNSYFLHSTYNIKKMLVIRSILTRPKEMDILKKEMKVSKKKTEYDQNYENTKNINLHGVFLLSIPVISFGLGIWQIERRKWKLELISDLKDKLSKVPVSMPENLNDLTHLDYQPIKVTGEFLYDNEFIIGPRSLIINGEAVSEGKNSSILHQNFNRGFNVITPFKIKDKDLTILVNRGWLSNKYKSLNERKKFQVEGIVEIIGINRLNETRPQFVLKNVPEQGVWNYRDIKEMAKFANTTPVFLDMIKSDQMTEMPVGSQTRVNLRNEHLNYIITWFGLSAFTGYYWFRIFIQKRPIF